MCLEPLSLPPFVKEVCVLQAIHKPALAFTFARAGSQGQPEVRDWGPLFPQAFPECVHTCSLLGSQELITCGHPVCLVPADPPETTVPGEERDFRELHDQSRY